MVIAIWRDLSDNLSMDKDKAQAELRGLANLADFSRRSKIPLRTLHRIASGEGVNIRPTTLMLVASALKRIKPAKKEETK
jgi:predicted transcriptional regulator